MIHPDKVRPSKWTDVKPLFNDGDFSAISGRYENGSVFAVGIRWNGDPDNAEDKGYPKTFAHPGWFVLPRYLVEPVLLKLLSETERMGGRFGNRENLLFALRKAAIQLRPNGIRYAIALYGAANTGKTKTLNLLVEKLIADVKGSVIVEKVFGQDSPAAKADRCVAIRVFGKLVVVMTSGDMGDIVSFGFRFAAEHNADILVAATRKRSDSSSMSSFVDNVVTNGVPYDIIEKTWTPDPAQADIQATKQAAELVERIRLG